MAQSKTQLPKVTKRGKAYIVHPRGLEIIEHMAAGGHPQVTIARALGIDPKTFREIKKRDEVVQNALDEGYGRLEHELVDCLLQQARQGQMVPAMFLLKTRCGYRESGPTDGKQVNTQINIQIPERMSDAEFQKIIQGSELDVSPN